MRSATFGNTPLFNLSISMDKNKHVVGNDYGAWEAFYSAVTWFWNVWTKINVNINFSDI